MKNRLTVQKMVLFMFAFFLILIEIAYADDCNPPEDIVDRWDLTNYDRDIIEDGHIFMGDSGFTGHFGARIYLRYLPFPCIVVKAELVCRREPFPYGKIFSKSNRPDSPTDPLVVIYDQNIPTLLDQGGKYSCRTTVDFLHFAELFEIVPGNIKSRQSTYKNFYLDLTRPNLSINSPSDGTVVKGGTEGFNIVVTSNDDVGTKEFTIKVDGIVRETINARERFNPNLQQYLRGRVYGTERRMITVIAKDEVERTDEKSFFVYSDDQPPLISNVFPPPGDASDPHRVGLRTTQSRVGIRADVIDRGRAGVKEVRLLEDTGRILDIQNRPHEGNTYLLQLTRPPGARHTGCYIMAFDKVGNMASTRAITIMWKEEPEKIRKGPLIPKKAPLPK